MLLALNLLYNNPFIPHGHCYLWKPDLVALHVMGDSLIALAYYSIPLTIIYFVRNREDLPFNWMFLLFGTFIIAGGTTHLMEVWTLWHPNYWLSGFIKAITAIVSLYTAGKLFPLVPQALALPSPMQMEIANSELKLLNEQLTEIQKELEIRVEERTAELTNTVSRLSLEIEERQKAEAALQESSAKFRRIFESDMIGIFFWHIDGRLLDANNAFLQLVGYSKEELTSNQLSWVDLTPAEYRDKDRKALDEIASNGVCLSFEKEYIRCDGSRVPVLVGGSRLEGFSDRGVSFVIDITQRKEDERKLRQWADIFQHTGQGLIVNSPNSEVLEIINPAFAFMYGYEVEELTESPISTIIAPESLPNLPKHVKMARERDRYVFEDKHVRKDGTVFPVLVDCTHVKNDKGKLLYSILNVTDITARKQAETEILTALTRERELSELKSRFTSMTSHEFRTPLTTILSSTELLEHYLPKLPEEEKQELFQQIETATQRMTTMLDDILTINQSEAGKIELKPIPINLEKFCAYLVKEMQAIAGNKYQITLTNTGECTRAVMDEKILGHILANVLSNAIKYSPDGGSVEFNLSCENQQAVFQVKDYGIGIPLEAQNKLFESFHRANNVGNIQGSGLGLSIVKRMVDLHGGSIDFSSEVGRGTKFTVSLPLK